MTMNPVRVARGTQSGLPAEPEGVVAYAAIADGSVAVVVGSAHAAMADGSIAVVSGSAHAAMDDDGSFAFGFADRSVAHDPFGGQHAAIASAITDAPTAPLRMTIRPPRFTTTTPGVMRRLPR